MAVVIYDVALYSITPASKQYSCPWRQYLSSLNVEWIDLNYGGTTLENLQAVVDPVNSWFGPNPDGSFLLSHESFPFLIYQKADSSINGGYPKHTVHLTLESLLADETFKNYEP